MPHKSILYFLIFSILTVMIRSQMSFVLNNYTLSPNYAKSLSSGYTFSFTAYNPSIGNMKIAVIFPSNFVLSTVTGCQIKLDTTVITGTTCSIDTTINQVNFNIILFRFRLTTSQFQMYFLRYKSSLIQRRQNILGLQLFSLIS